MSRTVYSVGEALLFQKCDHEREMRRRAISERNAKIIADARRLLPTFCGSPA